MIVYRRKYRGMAVLSDHLSEDMSITNLYLTSPLGSAYVLEKAP